VNDLEAVALDKCRSLLDTAGARRCDCAESLVIIAFVFGAAWALGQQDLLAVAEAQMRSEQ